MSRFALAVALAAGFAAPARAADPIYLDQGWTAEDRLTYYYLPQGSEVMPYAWFLALEEPWGDRPFRNDAHMAAFRYSPMPPSKTNPDGLPIGFAKGLGKDGAEWFGLTCAACHTGEFTYRGKTVRVDGGTTLADIMGFQSALVTSVKATLAEPAKFGRFARRVLGGNHPPEKAKALAADLRKHPVTMANWEATSRPAHPGGHGVWDALGILLNSITGTAPGTPDNYRVPHTPVSYPSIWDTNRYDKLLWNAAVESVTLRQVGEVIIVFGRAEAVVGKDGKITFDSSADLKALQQVYDYTMKLEPPKWPEDVLGKIDRDLAKRGEPLYREHCAKCHPVAGGPAGEVVPPRRPRVRPEARRLPDGAVGGVVQVRHGAAGAVEPRPRVWHAARRPRPVGAGGVPEDAVRRPVL